jgi:hypothetical protein
MTKRTLCPPFPIRSCLPTLLGGTITLISKGLATALPSIDFRHQQQLVLDHTTVRSIDAGILFTIEPLYGPGDMIAPSSR